MYLFRLRFGPFLEWRDGLFGCFIVPSGVGPWVSGLPACVYCVVIVAIITNASAAFQLQFPPSADWLLGIFGGLPPSRFGQCLTQALSGGSAALMPLSLDPSLYTQWMVFPPMAHWVGQYSGGLTQ